MYECVCLLLYLGILNLIYLRDVESIKIVKIFCGKVNLTLEKFAFLSDYKVEYYLR